MDVVIKVVVVLAIIGGLIWLICRYLKWDMDRWERKYPGYNERMAKIDQELDEKGL